MTTNIEAKGNVAGVNVQGHGIVSVGGDVNAPINIGGKSEVVNYTVLQVNRINPEYTLTKLASVINLKLKEEDTGTISFVPPKDYNEWKYSNKLFIYGVNGCGKSRTLYEIIKEKLLNY